MHIALGLPTRRAATRPDLLRDWILRGESGPYASIAVTERITDATLEPLTALAVAAGMTTRVRLLASVIVAPIREVTLLARQAATLDVVSGGRLSLGLGVGARRGDYELTGADFGGRGRAFDAQLTRLRATWGSPLAGEDVQRLGPPTARAGGPELLIGGYVEAVARRVATFGDGYMAPGGATPAAIGTLWRRVQDAWAEVGRPGRPRFLMGTYYALGPRAAELADTYIAEAYGHDAGLAARRRASLPTTPEQVRTWVAEARAAGADEVVLRPCGAAIELADRLTEVVAG